MSEESGKAYREERHRGHSAVCGRRPDPQPVAEAGDLAPGTAPDAGCGEGADAVWLASRGWTGPHGHEIILHDAVLRAREHP
ncbi:hypothetical protein [Streptosporangium roseum]|uniref:Uncharacterized protein n=1 Tax=Streptosporangium roseum (strain ATCC 12428 / DSM 43021 / JCM 3005 / KCTC 9067 / NCIMB 10171 / NRRL 2505 / NI 9100) TaxID=479432 RepID=D2BDM7_STRRD|nr:hypothetical protein [Streptosporangium roseum]ACZ88119.1 hypothetical protein Sros_5356 [Streptosporangium roseum DSM 43021]